MAQDTQVTMNLMLSYLPTVFMCFVLIAATLDSKQSGLGTHNLDLGMWGVPHSVDLLVRKGGVILPFSVLLLQTLVLSHDELKALKVIGEDPPAPFPCLPGKCKWLGLPKTWAWGVMILWVVLALLRLVLFFPLRTYHLWFSDHIFLITCVIAQLQTKLFLLTHTIHTMKGEQQEEGEGKCGMSVKTRARVLLAFSWVLIVLLLVESFFTAKYFHSVKADWLAFVSGVVLFGGFTGYWMWNSTPREDDPTSRFGESNEPGELEQPLMG